MLNKTENIFLIGPIGAGKTTIGRQVALCLSRDFYDTDQAVEKKTGVDVAWIFDVEGEEGFRQRETEVIDELTQLQGIVLATGGDSILSSANCRMLASRGLVVYLRVSVEEQLKRTIRDTRRPLLLRALDKRKALEQSIREREPLYESIADLVFDTNEKTVRRVADRIVQKLRDDKEWV